MPSSFSCLGFMSRSANSVICVPSWALALAPAPIRHSAASEIPNLSLSVIGSTFSSTRIEIKRPHSSNMTRRSRTIWLRGCIKGDGDRNHLTVKCSNCVVSSGSSEDNYRQIPTETQSLVEGTSTIVSHCKKVPDIQYLEEAIKQQGPRAIGFFGTPDMGFMQQQLIEILSYAIVIANNHIFTSGAFGANTAAIRGALRTEKPELLTVILPQSLKKQPPESQELLSKVKNLIAKPENDHLPLGEASRLCNMTVLAEVQQVICFAFHDSKLLVETCEEAKNLKKIVTLFYLD